MKANPKVLLAIFFFTLSVSGFAEEIKYLCITEEAGGLVHKGGSWQATSFEVEAKYLITMESGALTSVKEFGAPDKWVMRNCRKLEPTESFSCTTNFDMFRYQPSTRRFVMAKTSGYTNEFEEISAKLSSTNFTPNISLGRCEKL